ncbi:NlpC/P60 family protein [Streptomyces sp. MS06]|uniref:C40 family peptidase n=1 Tax=Streptomyces sp. MS06 TaxID=3385974 RepID=UPI0039A04E0B
MGRGRRGLVAVAVTVVCAVTVLGAPGTAFAHAGNTSGPDPSPSTPASASPTPPPDKELEAVRARLDALYHQAALATDAYNAAEEKAQRQSAELVELAGKIVETRQRLDALKDRAGAAARQQYRTGGLPPAARLVLSDDPRQFLDGASLIAQGERAAGGLIEETVRAQQDLKQYSADASAHWRELEANRKAKAAAKQKVEKQVAEAEQLESRLEKEQRERLAELERQAAAEAQTAWLDSGALDEVKGKASTEGEQAVRYATGQLGKPYEWGAEGPRTYDCSGLTFQAWAHAGHPIPRTSQEQWKQLHHVDVADMRPGDLVIYFADASHVGMYIGDGKVVHAPRPGRTVTVTGAGSMPILGVVRPDA